MKYDALGQLETFAEDMAYIAIKSGLHRHLPKSYEKTVSNSNQFDYHSPPGGDSYSSSSRPNPKAVQYFRSLDVDRRRKLYSLYELDFQLFGYDPEPYM